MGLGPSDVIAGSGDDEKLEPGNRLSSGTEMSSGSFRAQSSPRLLEQLVPCDDLPLRLERLRSAKRATAPLCPASGIPSFHSGFRDVHSSFSGSRDTAALAATALLRTTPPDLSLAGASRTRSQTWTQTRRCCMRRGNTRGWVAQTLCWDFSPAQMSVSCRPVALATTDGVLKFDKKIVRERSHLFANVNVRDLCREPRVCVRKSLETGLLDRKIGAEDGVHCYLTHAVPVDRRRLQLPEVSQLQAPSCLTAECPEVRVSACLGVARMARARLHQHSRCAPHEATADARDLHERHIRGTISAAHVKWEFVGGSKALATQCEIAIKRLKRRFRGEALLRKWQLSAVQERPAHRSVTDPSRRRAFGFLPPDPRVPASASAFG